MYEGEGWLTQDKKGFWQIAIKMTDYDCLKYFHEIVGVGSLRGPYKNNGAEHYKPYWTWRSCKAADIFNVVAEFYPYVCERRRAKFDEFLTHHYGN